jgi:peptide methionine sulfoxide reductase msrA/msrB
MSFRRIIQGVILVISTSLLLGACANEKPADKARVAPAHTGAVDSIVLGMGCFWGAEKRMAAIPGVLDVESGYANGDIEGKYDAVLAHEHAIRMKKTNLRNHAEVVKVSFDPSKVDLETVLIQFWESHDPTQGDRQGNDIGTNYRSAIYTQDEAQQAVALKTSANYQRALTAQRYGSITTEIAPLKSYFSAEEYHQDYLEKNPNGYCGLGGTGVKYPDDKVAATASQPAPGKVPPLDGKVLNFERQLVVFEAHDCL